MQNTYCEFAKMRYKNPEDRQSQKRGLGSDAAIIVTLIKEQPLEKKQLIEKAHVSDSSFSRVEPILLREKLLKQVDGGYALWYFESNVTILEDIFKDLKKNERYYVKIEELANLAGIPPKEIESEAYRLAKKYGISFPYEW
jgi:hypothetical protein